MTPLDVLIAFALTYFAVHFVDWMLAPNPKRRPIVVAVCLVLALAWVYLTRVPA